jgi:hypothetical protein
MLDLSRLDGCKLAPLIGSYPESNNAQLQLAAARQDAAAGKISKLNIAIAKSSMIP